MASYVITDTNDSHLLHICVDCQGKGIVCTHSLLISFIGVQILGPKFMEKRKPFKLRKIIVTYNLLQAIASFYLFFEAGRISWFGRYNWRCAAVDFSNDEYAMRVIACLIGQFLNDNCPSNVF